MQIAQCSETVRSKFKPSRSSYLVTWDIWWSWEVLPSNTSSNSSRMLTNYDKALLTIDQSQALFWCVCSVFLFEPRNLPRWTVLKQFYDELWDLFNLEIPLLTWHHTIRGDFIIYATYEFDIIKRLKHSPCFEWMGMTDDVNMASCCRPGGCSTCCTPLS